MKRVVSLDDELGQALRGLGLDVTDGSAAFAEADFIAMGPDWSALRTWRVAGHTMPVLARLDASGPPEDRAALEPLAVVGSVDPASVRAALAALAAGQGRGRLDLPGAHVDLARRRVARGGREVLLTQREADLIAYLAARPGREVGREELLVQVWGHARPVSLRSVDMAVLRLRRKLEPDPSNPVALLSSYGGGYRLVSPTDDSAPAGRRTLASVLRTELERPGVVTLTGPAGVGKTHLAEFVLADGPSTWVRLAPARSGPDVDAAVAGALGLSGGEPGALAAGLASLGAVRVALDNAEHVRGPLAERLTGWANEAPAITWLVTSQVALGLPGERELVVGPLDPAASRALYASRAGRPALAEDPALPALLDRLDHLPLAIGLAAARASVLPPSALLARFDDELLRAGASDPRHGSLAAALAWTWAWLEPVDREALTRWSAFRGPFSLDAGAAVWEGALTDAVDALDRSLARGLVRRAEGRFELLASVRDAARRLGEASHRRAGEAAHVRWFEALAAGALRGLDGPDPAPHRAALVADRAELAAAVARGAGPIAARAYDRALTVVGTAPERLAVLDRALTGAPDPVERARLRLARAAAGRLIREPSEILADLEAAVDGLAGAERSAAVVRLAHWCASRGDRERARVALDADLAVRDDPHTRAYRLQLDPVGDPVPEILVCAAAAQAMGSLDKAWEILTLAYAAADHRGDHAGADAVLVEVSAVADRLGDPDRLGVAAMFTAERHLNAGRLDAGEAAIEMAIPAFERAGRLDARRRAQETRVLILLERGEDARARVEVARLVALHAARGSGLGQGWARQHAATLLLVEGRYDELRVEAGVVEAAGREHGSVFLRQRGALFGALAAIGRGEPVALSAEPRAGSNALLAEIALGIDGVARGDRARARASAGALRAGTSAATPAAGDWLALADALEEAGRASGLAARRPSHPIARGAARLLARVEREAPVDTR